MREKQTAVNRTRHKIVVAAFSHYEGIIKSSNNMSMPVLCYWDIRGVSASKHEFKAIPVN